MFKNSTLSDNVYRELKDEILSGYFEPGQRLYLEKEAARLNVSMTPLQAAFRKLEQEGLVKITSRRGTFIKKLSEKDIYEYSVIRFALERCACESLTRKGPISEEQEKELREINKTVEDAINREAQRDFITADSQFHLKIAEFSGNYRLVSMLKSFPLSNFLVLMGFGSVCISNGDKILREHEEIIKALKESNLEALISSLKNNIFSLLEKINYDPINTEKTEEN